MGDFKKRGGFGGGKDRRGGGFRGGPNFSGGKFSRGGNRGGFRSSEMFNATCAECHKNCEVPFRPNGDKPVFCSDCFRNKGGSNDFPRRESRNRDFSKKEFSPAPRPVADGGNVNDLKKQLENLSSKVDRLIEMMQKNFSASQNQSASNRVDTVSLAKAVNKVVSAPKKEEKKVAARVIKTIAKKKAVSKKK